MQEHDDETVDRPTFHLVYQGGLANLFIDTDGKPRRVHQGSFRECENMARGALLAGADLEVWHANVAGNCSLTTWSSGKGGPFDDQQHPPSVDSWRAAGIGS